MDTWYSIVRTLEDESEDAYQTQQFVFEVFRQLKGAKLKDKQKFKNRMGPEFERWTAQLVTQFPEDLVKEVLNDDDFWIETLAVTQGI
jgi:hypothetical protein